MVTDTATNSMSVIDSLKWRYATKSFDPSKKIPDHLWKQLEEVLQLSPSSFGLQPYRFIVITDQSIKQQLVAASWNQKQVADCSHLVVFARLKELTAKHIDRYMDIIAETKGVTLDSLQAMKGMISAYIQNSSPEELANWMSRQCYIALGNLMTAASILQIDNCPMEGLVKDEYDQILQLPEKGCNSVVMCALGYRAADDKYAQLAKVRFPASELFIKV